MYHVHTHWSCLPPGGMAGCLGIFMQKRTELPFSLLPGRWLLLCANELCFKSLYSLERQWDAIRKLSSKLLLVQDSKWPAAATTLKSAALTQSWEWLANSEFLGTAAEQVRPSFKWPCFSVHQGPVIVFPGLVLALRQELAVKHCLLEIFISLEGFMLSLRLSVIGVLSSVYKTSCLNFA